jgi:(E)-4-hydroxy-3-methylbut-2-enyl-diphosphate synthase
MADVSTMDTEAALRQAIRLAEAGADYVRFTAQGTREALQLGIIRRRLRELGYGTPLIADIHFNPKAAEAAAASVEKVRINPGNFAAGAIRPRFVPFLHLCRAHGTAIRIGVNHGSLSPRIMNRYGDTPEGMVESCMEYLRICREEAFGDVVVSMKASAATVMVKAVRLLVQTMDAEDMHFPLHLGVTEAGDHEDGRIKSATGIGALLADGIGDTIRVSLSEPPEAEIPVARKLADYFRLRANQPPIHVPESFHTLASDRLQHPVRMIRNIGGSRPPVVISDRRNGDGRIDTAIPPDYICGDAGDIPRIVDAGCWTGRPDTFPCFAHTDGERISRCNAPLKFVRLSLDDLDDRLLRLLRPDPAIVLLARSRRPDSVGETRALVHRLREAAIDAPLILHRHYRETDLETLRIKAAADLGALLIDGIGHGVLLTADPAPDPRLADSCAFSILQATRRRISRTEYISCPGCGRTLYDLRHAVARVKQATAHLKGLKIAIMGCIVNGPGEMADADYGYVGAAKGRVNLYRGRDCILKNIPEDDAVEQLLQLIHADSPA